MGYYNMIPYNEIFVKYLTISLEILFLGILIKYDYIILYSFDSKLGMLLTSSKSNIRFPSEIIVGRGDDVIISEHFPDTSFSSLMVVSGTFGDIK